MESHDPGQAADRRQAHAAHHRFEKTAAAAFAEQKATIPAPSQSLDPESEEVVARLETLDDAVFDAINGHEAAVSLVQSLWPALRAELGDELLAESREQYLRYAISVWEQCLDGGAVRDPARAVHALDVLTVLFDEV
jgi:hypothetical protein